MLPRLAGGGGGVVVCTGGVRYDHCLIHLNINHYKSGNISHHIISRPIHYHICHIYVTHQASVILAGYSPEYSNSLIFLDIAITLCC